MSSTNLLRSVQGLLERTYRMSTGLDTTRFVIGERGFRRIYENGGHEVVASPDGSGARTLVRETAEGLRLSVFYPRAMIDRLEDYPPQHGLGDENVDAFAVLVEELDHLLLIAERFHAERPVSAFELELHANVSKHLVLSRFLAGDRGRLQENDRLWLRHHLFDKGRFSDDDPAVRDRYRDAIRWAVRFLDALADIDTRHRLGLLRRFHGEGAAGKLELIRGLA